MSPMTRAVLRVRISSPTVLIRPWLCMTTVFVPACQFSGAFAVSGNIFATERAITQVALVAVMLFRAA